MRIKKIDRYLSTIICVLLFILYAWPDSSPPPTSFSSDDSSSSHSEPLRRETASAADVYDVKQEHNGASDVAIASIAVGPKARFSASYLVRSFVRNSNFHGPLYLITDDPSYYDFMQDDFDAHPETQVIFLQITDRSIGDMPLPLLPLSTIFKENRYGHVQWARLSDYKRKRLEIKWLKTKLFEFINAHRYVIFMDSDILIGQPLRPFIEHCKSLQRTGGSAIVTLFTDIGNTGSPYHTGVVWLAQATAPPLLEVWGVTISRGIFGSDQRAIEYSINQLEATERVAFIHIGEDSRFFTFINGTVIENARPYTFIHTTSYRLENGPKFGMSNDTIAQYFGDVIQTPWKPWTGTASMSYVEREKQLADQIALKQAFVDRLLSAPFKKPTVIARHQGELDVMTAQLTQLLAEKAKAQKDDDEERAHRDDPDEEPPADE